VAASLLGPAALAAQSILLVSATTTFQAPFALSVAATARVGNLLGQTDARRAAISTHASFFIAFFIAMVWRCGYSSVIATWIQLIFVYSAVLLVFRNHWAKLFNDDPGMVASFFSRFRDADHGSEVICLVSSILPLLAIFQLVDGMGTVVGGILRVQGRQATGALLNLV